MANCPTCLTALRTVRQREGIYFACETCGGRAVTVPQIRRVAGDRFATGLLRRINMATVTTARTCPFCSQRMRQFQIPQPELTLDACKPCDVVWFDPSEFEAVPEGSLETTDNLELRGREALALHKIEVLAEQRRRDEMLSGAPPDEDWKWVPAFLGLPVKIENAGVSCHPWLTWSTAAAIALASGLAFFDLDRIVDSWGFLPAHPWRHAGLNSLASFFLHGSWGHLLGNLYFLLLCGNNVEDYLGRWRWLGLVLLSTVTGDLVHFLGDPHSTVPSIGASGGISGLIAFYALEFPRARLGFLVHYYWRLSWIQIPAWAVFFLWLALQLFGSYQQLAGLSNVSSLAHLGGCGMGFILWLWWRRLSLNSANAET